MRILSATREKWPEGASKIIYIQQDNAKPHILDNDPIFREAANQNGFNIHLVQQLPNSPDMKVLNLGFLGLFNHYDTRKQHTTTHNYF